MRVLHSALNRTDFFVGKLAERERVKSADSAWQGTVWHDYALLEKEWRSMEEKGHCTAFQTYDWVASWYDAAVLHGAAKPLIVTVSANETGPMWILPLCLYRNRGLRVISFADLGVTDYAAPVIGPSAPTDERAVKAMINAAIKALPPCDLIRLQKLPEKFDGVDNPLLHLPGLVRFSVDSYGIRLHKPWPELAGKIMQPRLRSTIRQKKKKIQEEGEVVIERNDTPEMLAQSLGRLFDMKDARFKAIGLPEMPAFWRDFYRNLASRRDRTLNVSISTMSVSGEVVATCLGLVWEKTYYAILPTFEMRKWSSFRPGLLLFDAMLTDFSEHVAEGYFDFTVGDEPYKMRMGGRRRALYEWIMPRSAAGAAAYLVWRGRHSFEQHCPRVSEFLKSAVSRVRG